jgi:hypothetical protein
LDFGCLDASRSRERIQVAHGKISWQMSSDIEGGSFRCRHGNSVDQHDVVGVYPLVAHHDAVGRATASPDHLDGRCRVNP